MKRIILLTLLAIATILANAATTFADDSAIDPAQLKRGELLYARYCYMCHQSGGKGNGHAFPPLAKSDYLAADKERSIRILITGLNGQITVKNMLFNGVMPPAPYDDAQLADVLTYVHNSFGNNDGPVTLEQVKAIHSKVNATMMVKGDPNPYPPLPAPPEGFTLREVCRYPNQPTRLASHRDGKSIYTLCENGDVWRVSLPGGALKRIIAGEDYAAPNGGIPNCVGLFLDPDNRLYIVVNEFCENTKPYATNQVAIYRTTGQEDGEPSDPKPWLKTIYPLGFGGFNHGVNNIAIGPDGFLYVSSGARTDSNEPIEDSNYYHGGEVALTSKMWRLDPRAENPEIQIYASGLRNSFGFCWNDKGEMFATENGPNVDAPEELNQIEEGKHYGFPYKFSNWVIKAYPYSPDPPRGLKFTLPIANYGPDAGGSEHKPLYTFDPHSSPGGIVFLTDDFPEGYRGTFFATRFGNLIKRQQDVGFDVIQIKLDKTDAGVYKAHVKTVLARLGRPIDLRLGGPGIVYIAEYTRVTDNSGHRAMLPGRLLELAVKK